jgi:hypothetical protein
MDKRARLGSRRTLRRTKSHNELVARVGVDSHQFAIFDE